MCLLAAGSAEVMTQVSGAHPMEITTDGAGTVFGGQAPQDRLVVEIMDPGRKTIGSTSLAELGVQEDAAVQEVCQCPAAHVSACESSPLSPLAMM